MHRKFFLSPLKRSLFHFKPAMFASVAALTVFMHGCSLTVLPPEEYVGTWQAPGIYLSICANGNANYRRDGERAKIKIDAAITEVAKDHFTLGFFADFRVHKPPYFDEERQTMVMHLDETFMVRTSERCLGQHMGINEGAGNDEHIGDEENTLENGNSEEEDASHPSNSREGYI